jgi:hypothetical protein
VDMDKQYVWTFSMDIPCSIDMDLQYWHRHAAEQWTRTAWKNIQIETIEPQPPIPICDQ